MDVVVSPRSRGTNTPLKIYEILASGIPLVATRIESHTQVLSRAICFLADPEPAALARAIESALAAPSIPSWDVRIRHHCNCDLVPRRIRLRQFYANGELVVVCRAMTLYRKSCACFGDSG